MSLDTSFLLAGSAVGLLAVLTLLVLAKRVARGITERRSRRRRVRWVAAVGTGAVPDMRMRELRALARTTTRSSAAQQDLLALLAAGRLPPRDDRREPFERALRRGGLARALRRSCRSRSAAKRGQAALLWAHLGFAGVERSIGPMTSDPDPDVRAAAIQALACCESEEGAWVLLRSLRDGRVEPARVTERLTGSWAVSPLLAVVHDPAFAELRPWLAEGLGLAGDARAERTLTWLLRTGVEEERIRACRALGRLGLRSSSTALVAALGDDSAGVRAQAARALGELDAIGSASALIGLVGDDSWWVRARAAEALLSLGGPGLVALRWCADSHPDRFARERAAEALLSVTARAEAAVA